MRERVCERVLLADGSVRRARLRLDGDLIAAVDADDAATAPDGRVLVPGIVDLHGDAFERQLMPRPGVPMPAGPALVDTDRQLAANGVTTAFLGLTCSWEQGLRSPETVEQVIAARDALAGRLLVDHRVHLRFEAMALDAVADARRWIGAGAVSLLAINDHFAMTVDAYDASTTMATVAGRSGVDVAAYRAELDRLSGRRDERDSAVADVVAAAQAAGVAVASHDDRSAEERRANRALGCRIVDFPIREAAALEARDAGEPVIMGAPNVVRGGSHMRNGISAAEMAVRGLCTALASDYYYPALPVAAVKLWREHGLDFARAWAMVSADAAATVCLADRGTIAPGQRADLVLLDVGAAGDPAPPRVAATWAAGHLCLAERGLDLA